MQVWRGPTHSSWLPALAECPFPAPALDLGHPLWARPWGLQGYGDSSGRPSSAGGQCQRAMGSKCQLEPARPTASPPHPHLSLTSQGQLPLCPSSPPPLPGRLQRPSSKLQRLLPRRTLSVLHPGVLCPQLPPVPALRFCTSKMLQVILIVALGPQMEDFKLTGPATHLPSGARGHSFCLLHHRQSPSGLWADPVLPGAGRVRGRRWEFGGFAQGPRAWKGQHLGQSASSAGALSGTLRVPALLCAFSDPQLLASLSGFLCSSLIWAMPPPSLTPLCPGAGSGFTAALNGEQARQAQSLPQNHPEPCLHTIRHSPPGPTACSSSQQ